MSFFAYYMGPPSGQFLRLLYGVPLRSVSSLTMWAPLYKLLRILYGGPLRSVSLFTIGGPLRSVSSHTIWGPPSDQFLRLLIGDLQFSFSLHFFYILKKNYALSYPWGAPIFLNFQGGGGKVPPLAPPCGRP